MCQVTDTEQQVSSSAIRDVRAAESLTLDIRLVEGFRRNGG
jgi:hypothetical protein